MRSDIKDSVVLPDEDISQNPELLRATLAKASAATIIALWRNKRKYIYFPQIFIIVVKTFLLQRVAGS